MKATLFLALVLVEKELRLESIAIWNSGKTAPEAKLVSNPKLRLGESA
jgi:hypothetical protein